MSISINSHTSITLTKPSEELTYIHTAYGPKLRVALNCPADQDKTDQSQAPECDINNIMARYQKTGQLEFVNQFEAQYQDVSAIEYQSSMETVAKAHSMFEEMPSKLRERFENDPGNFLEFVGNPENKKEMAELGLLNPLAASKLLNPVPTPPEPEKQPKEAVNPAKEPVPKSD
ncbi:MAG: internal scaffolding protein [Wigfec virus K19_161]|nr:MAG: internal scaffolding protein [Wigfec virus K19_161]